MLAFVVVITGKGEDDVGDDHGYCYDHLVERWYLTSPSVKMAPIPSPTT